MTVTCNMGSASNYLYLVYRMANLPQRIVINIILVTRATEERLVAGIWNGFDTLHRNSISLLGYLGFDTTRFTD